MRWLRRRATSTTTPDDWEDRMHALALSMFVAGAGWGAAQALSETILNRHGAATPGICEYIAHVQDLARMQWEVDADLSALPITHEGT